MGRLNYHHLEYFRAVAHEGNLTRAADALHVSQSSVSVQIKKLERALGHDLFDRRGRGLVLTEAGRIALDHADAIFSTGDDLLGTLQERGRARVVLRIGAISTLSRNFQLRFLEPLHDRSDVEIIMRSGLFQDLVKELEAHSLDVVLTNWTPRRDGATRWVAHTIAHQPLSLIGLPDPVEEDAPLEALLTSRPLILPARESSMRLGFDALAERLDVRVQVAAEVDDMAMLRLLARDGIGNAVIPPIVVRDELASGALRELARLPGLRETFYAITMQRRFPNPLLQELLQAAPLEE